MAHIRPHYPQFVLGGQVGRRDIPVEVIMAQIVSGGSVAMEGFKVDDDGSIVRTGVAEETDVVHDEPTTGGRDSIVAVSLGRGHRVKVVSTRYGAAWAES